MATADAADRSDAAMPARHVLALRHVPHESLGTIAEAFDQRGLSYRYLDWFENPEPRFRMDQLAGLVVLGGPMNVDQTERFPFLATEVEWIRQAIAAEVPVLGICLGSQLIAKALGARVYANRVKEIGWYEVQMTPAAVTDPLFAPCSTTETVFQWHGDTFDLPADAVLLARGSECENQAFRYGRSVYALQFHLEVTAEMIEQWLSEPGNVEELETLDYINPTEIRRRTSTELASMLGPACHVFQRFAELCQRRDRAAGSF